MYFGWLIFNRPWLSSRSTFIPRNCFSHIGHLEFFRKFSFDSFDFFDIVCDQTCILHSVFLQILQFTFDCCFPSVPIVPECFVHYMHSFTTRAFTSILNGITRISNGLINFGSIKKIVVFILARCCLALTQAAVPRPPPSLVQKILLPIHR